MTTKKNTNLFQKGVSGNKNGRPKTATGKGKPISRLRSTLNKLKQLEPDAVDVIEKSLLGQTKSEEEQEGVAKSQVDTAKWIITSISSLTRTAIAEESYKAGLLDNPTPEAKATGTDDSVGKPARFTTHIIEED